MGKEKIKVYTYTRVSTSMQIDGYSLDAQKSRMKAFCEFNDYEIAGEYEDAGKSGKSIEGRVAFNNMMEDIKSGNIDSILPSRTIGTAFLYFTNSKHDILSNEIVLMRTGYKCY